MSEPKLSLAEKNAICPASIRYGQDGRLFDYTRRNTVKRLFRTIARIIENVNARPSFYSTETRGQASSMRPRRRSTVNTLAPAVLSIMSM